MDTDNLPVKPPSAQTLKRYGLTQKEWLKTVEAQGWVCPICGKLPANKKLVTDHLHMKGFSDKKLRKKLFNTFLKRQVTFRGCPCLRCNLSFLSVGMTPEIARNVIKYLEAYEEKRKILETKLKEIESKSIPSTVLPEGNT